MEFQNQYKKLKNIVMLFLGWKGICLTKYQDVHHEIEKKEKRLTLKVVCGGGKLLPCPSKLSTLSTVFAFRHDGLGRNWLFYVRDVKFSVFLRFSILNFGFLCIQIRIHCYQYLICLKPLLLRFRQCSTSPYSL